MQTFRSALIKQMANDKRQRAKKIAPSILSADFSRLGDEVRAVEEAGADYIHVDVMDGHFVPNLTVGPVVVQALRRVTRLPLDVHLMIEEPDRYLEDFARAGSNILTVHVEACRHLNGTVNRIKGLGLKAGVALNPATPLSSLDYIMSEADLILVMTVNPGFGGQDFIPACLPKIAKLREMVDARGLSLELEVDGGINLANIKDVAEAGARVFVSGKGVFGKPDYSATIKEMRRLIGA